MTFRSSYESEGDQFHYLWAVGRRLLLLHRQSRLVAVVIDGASKVKTKLEKTTD